MFPLITSILLLLVSGLGPAASRWDNDKIISLPGVLRMPSFPLYSGYLRVNDNKALHYWLVTCEKQSSNDLIIWFNGGPGCSSLDGLFTENGPYKFNTHGDLYENPYSWNKLAHVLYIESPAGVGFSRGPPAQHLNDDTTADDVIQALLDFFDKFNELSRANIYVTGESYAGFYVPILVTRLHDVHHIWNRIKGVMIGNPLLYQDENFNSLAYFTFYHGVFGPTTWDKLVHNCCGGDYRNVLAHRCNFYQRTIPSCIMEVVKLVHSVYNSGINIYNIYQDCAHSETSTSMRYFKDMIQRTLKTTIQEKYHGKEKHKLLKLMNEKVIKLTPPCSNSSSLKRYLNRPDVQRAIHVDNVVWDVCSQEVSLNFQKIYTHAEPFLLDILKPENDIRMLLYFGDMDMACNHLGGEWIADSLKIPITLPRRPWTILKDGVDQIAGYVKIYDKLTYATVKGAGHMVPTDKPHVAYKMVKQFLNDEPL